MALWREREEDVESQLSRSASWAVTYGDLMSYLVIFFLLLYAAAAGRSVAMDVSFRGVEEKFGKEEEAVQELFSRHGVQQIAKLEIGEDRMRIVFLEPVLFDPGSATLKEASLPHLALLIPVLSAMPNPIQIEGHTDDRPLGRTVRFESNWELSASRAFSILKAFERLGIPPGRLSAIGYGEYRPLASNDTAEGRAANRRIEVNLVRRKN